MPFYIKVPLSEDGVIDTNGKLQRVDTRAHASELYDSDAGHAKGVADECGQKSHGVLNTCEQENSWSKDDPK